MDIEKHLDRKRIGAQIYTLEQLDEAAKREWQVVVLLSRPGKSRPRGWQWAYAEPASLMINLSGATLLDIFSCGLFQYKKKE